MISFESQKQKSQHKKVREAEEKQFEFYNQSEAEKDEERNCIINEVQSLIKNY